VFLEAAACGVPSVGYAVGGVPEAIKHGATGILAKETTPEALGDAILRIHDDADLRNALANWARITFENERTLECSYHRLHAVLRRFLAGGESMFGRKISLRPQQAREDRPASDAWEALTGFSDWEGPYPDWNLPRCRWQDHRVGSFHVMARDSGAHTLLIRYRNTAPGQQLRIECAGRKVFLGPIPVSRNLEDSLLSLDVELDEARSLVTSEASSASPSPEGRALYILVSGVEVLPKSGQARERPGLWTTIRSLPRRLRAWFVRRRD